MESTLLPSHLRDHSAAICADANKNSETYLMHNDKNYRTTLIEVPSISSLTLAFGLFPLINADNFLHKNAIHFFVVISSCCFFIFNFWRSTFTLLIFCSTNTTLSSSFPCIFSVFMFAIFQYLKRIIVASFFLFSLSVCLSAAKSSQEILHYSIYIRFWSMCFSFLSSVMQSIYFSLLRLQYFLVHPINHLLGCIR